MSDQERHSRVSAVFLSVCDLPPEERGAVVARECGGDVGLRGEVEAMLAADTDATFLASPVPAPPADDLAPERIGPYRVVRLLGRGGTAVVYEAQQDRPNRRVALKVLRRVWASPELVRRLELEAEALARLQHPGIATVYDVGTAEGAPYLAMELVRGTALTVFAAENKLPLRRRLELFAAVCDAVQHAHQRGIIHRDLKPANILVEDGGAPKIVDFGVARLVDLDPSLTMHTHAGSVVGTLAYMSPEQGAGDARNVDARTDVYSLGALLFELLSGRLPIDIAGKPIAEAVRAVQEDPPTPLGKYYRAFRGDLETIAARALEKDPSRRYPGASDLATDVRRFLTDETILARPAGSMYELGKFVRRHRAPVAGCAAFVLLTLAGAAVVVTLRERAVRAEHASNQAGLRAEQLRTEKARNARLFMDLVRKLAAVEGQRGPGTPSATSTATVVAAADELLSDAHLSEDLWEESTYHREIAGICMRLRGLQGIAQTHYRRALELWDQANPRMNLERARLVVLVAHCLLENGRFEEAADHYEALVGFVEASEYPDSRNMATVLDSLASALAGQGKHDEAVTVRRRHVNLERRLNSATSPEVIDALALLGKALHAAGRTAEAADALVEAPDLCERASPPNPSLSIRPLRYLARLDFAGGHYERAESARHRVLVLCVEKYGGENHQEVATSLLDLARSLEQRGDEAGAEWHLLRALSAVRNAPLAFPANEALILNAIADLIESQPERLNEAALLRQQAAQAQDLAMNPSPETATDEK